MSGGMFNNLVNRHDAVTLGQRLVSAGPSVVRRMLAGPAPARVAATWDGRVVSDSQWYAVPAVHRRRRLLVTGDAECDFSTWALARVAAGRRDLRALVPGCGSGYHVGRWAALGAFTHIDAFDLSPVQVAGAQADARTARLDHVLSVGVADMRTVALEPAHYDMVVAEHALHHFAPVTDAIDRLATALKPGGVLYADEFVGPTLHQWPARQLELANDHLARLPRRLRMQENGREKTRVLRPSRCRMYLLDPSEAVDSAAILPALRRTFEIDELRGYGGSLLQLVLSGIGHHFADDDAEAKQHLQALFAAEDALLARGELAHDFVVALCRRPAT